MPLENLPKEAKFLGVQVNGATVKELVFEGFVDGIVQSFHGGDKIVDF